MGVLLALGDAFFSGVFYGLADGVGLGASPEALASAEMFGAGGDASSPEDIPKRQTRNPKSTAKTAPIAIFPRVSSNSHIVETPQNSGPVSR